MITYEAYKFIHVLSVIVLFLSLGTYSISVISKTDTGRRLAGVSHGIAMLFILVAGFGLIARLGYPGMGAWPTWIWVKVGVWILLAGSLTAIKRVPRLAPLLWFLLPAIGGVAVYMAIYQPG